MIINSQRTIYGLEYQANRLLGLPHTARVNTTLNEKFKVLINEPAGADTDPSVKYLAIGVGGARMSAGSTSYSYSQHSPVDAALFEQIPFVMCPINADITATEQAKYRLKVMINYSGVDYYQYFLKRIVSADIHTDTYLVNTDANGLANISLMDTNSVIYLNPQPRPITTVPNTAAATISKMIKIRFQLTPTELNTITNVIDILYGVGVNKPITEIGICGGLEKTINGVVEAIQTQIYFHVGLDVDARLRYDPAIGYLRAIELGSTEPLYA